jgi:tetratricopeptide (TPR) repeat protein
MYNEAESALKSAVKADEFNAELRYRYGVALQGLKKFDDAIASFQLSLRLDSGRWVAAEHILECYSEKFAQSSTNQDRVALGEVAAELALFPLDGLSESSIKDLREAQRRAEALLTALNSPVGRWSLDGRPQLLVRWNSDGRKFEVSEEEGVRLISGSFRQTMSASVTSDSYAGRVSFFGSGFYAATPCWFDFEFTIQLEDFGSKLLLQEQSSNYKGPDPVTGDPSIAGIRARDKVCRDIVRESQRRGSRPFYPLRLSLERGPGAQ